MQVNYENMIDLDSVTLEDCIDLYDKKGICTILNDGRITNFAKGDLNE